MQKLVSVIVPIYGVEEYIVRCIESILGQTYRRIEIILVDDGSPDSCPKICDEYEKQDSRVQVLHKENGGLVSARQAGTLLAKGEYITFVDGDDWIESTYIELILSRAIDANADIVLAGFKKFSGYKDYTVITNIIENGIYNRKKIESDIFPKMISSEIKFRSGISPAVWCKLFKASLIKEAIYDIDKNITVGEDVVLTYPCIMLSNIIYICNDICGYCYRTGIESMTGKCDEKYIFHLEHLFLDIDKRIINYSHKDITQQIIQYKVYMILQHGIANSGMGTCGKINLFSKLMKYNKNIKTSKILCEVITNAISKKDLFELWQYKALIMIEKKKFARAVFWETIARRFENKG